MDGSGMFHPRLCGSASHLGITQDLRTIGVAKKLMCFEDFDKDRGEEVGASHEDCKGASAASEAAESKSKRVKRVV